jgi:hypothetical protein
MSTNSREAIDITSIFEIRSPSTAKQIQQRELTVANVRGWSSLIFSRWSHLILFLSLFLFVSIAHLEFPNKVLNFRGYSAVLKFSRDACSAI